MSYSEPEYGTRNLFRALGVFYRPSHLVDANPFSFITGPMTTHLETQRSRHDRCPIHSARHDKWPEDICFRPPWGQTRSVLESVTYHGDSDSRRTTVSTHELRPRSKTYVVDSSSHIAPRAPAVTPRPCRN